MLGAARGSFRFDLEVEIGDGQRWSTNWSNSSGHQGIGAVPGCLELDPSWADLSQGDFWLR